MNDGIIFFPHEVYPSDEIKHIFIKFGIAGYGVIYKLLERIYSLGYYTPWNEDICILFADECRLTTEHIQPIIDYAVLKGFFNAEMYQKHSILTSADIQSKFFFAAKNRAELKVKNDFLLVDLQTILSPDKDVFKPDKNAKKEDFFKAYLAAEDIDKQEEIILKSDVFKPWLSQFEAIVIVYAFAICVRKNKKNLDYLFGILANWKKSGYTSLNEIDDPILSVPDFLGDCPEYLYRSNLDF